jgi:hypothetical protein
MRAMVLREYGAPDVLHPEDCVRESSPAGPC